MEQQRRPIVVGRRFGRLVVQAKRYREGRVYWECKCDCGATTQTRASRLNAGQCRSCGCLARDTSSVRNRRHGETSGYSQSKEYFAWLGMKSRCNDPKSKGYHNYGGRGITVCSKWNDSFQEFLGDVGRAPSKAHSLDRIDVNLGYQPGNVRWATMKEQRRNTRDTLRWTWNGVTRPIVDWCAELGANYDRVVARIGLGWSIERAMLTPVDTRKWTAARRERERMST